VIMAVLIAAGGFLLRLFHVPDPTTTSFLAVGMVAVISLLFLLDFLLSLWMLLVIPIIAVAMYLLAYWVTTAFVEGEPTDHT
jgi:predicted acyltransferase